MAKKHFIFGYDKPVDKRVLKEIQAEKEKIHLDSQLSKEHRALEKMQEDDDLIHVEGRVVIKIDVDYKDSWTFANGQKIEYKRRFNNFNQRETSPVNAVVISGEGISRGAEILIHPNAIHDSNRIFNYKDSNDSVKYYAIHNDMCFAWHDGENWQPLAHYDFGLRLFKPYEGLIIGLPPEQIKNVLYVTTGKLKGNVVKTLVACDYQIVFQGRAGTEESLIRFRPFGDEKNKREEEAVAILHDDTEKVLSGQYLIGISISDAKPYSCFKQLNTSP